MTDPHLWEREILVKTKDAAAGEMYLSGATAKLSKPPARALLGYDQATLAALRSAGVIA
jgi:hypothetical protein